MEEIIFKDIPNISAKYKAGSDGNIYSFYKSKPRKLSAGESSNGNYKNVSVVDTEGNRKSRDIHRLICMAFHGLPPTNKHQVAHNDGNGFNNIPNNLRWDSVRNNLADKYKHGTQDVGVNNSRAAINDAELFVLRWLVDSTTLTHEEVGKILGLSRVFVSKVISGQRYKNYNVGIVSNLINPKEENV